MTSIAIIDDVKSNRWILGKIIETIDPSIAIHDFDRAEQALDWANNQTPDLVITDYKLPGLDGIGFVKRFRSHPKSREIPVLMMTMVDDLLLPTRARVAGVTAFIRRPVDHHLAWDRIRNLLPPHRSRKRLQLVVDNSQPHSPA
jgi:response regulator RpfG family c-di-GMP phosphodiesterase